MTTIDDFSDAADRELLECGNWIVGQYIIVSDSDKGSKLDRIKEERQIERAVTGLLGDGKLYPLFQPAIKLIESVFCMNEYKKRKPMVKDPAKALQLDGKGEITPENVHYYLRVHFKSALSVPGFRRTNVTISRCTTPRKYRKFWTRRRTAGRRRRF